MAVEALPLPPGNLWSLEHSNYGVARYPEINSPREVSEELENFIRGITESYIASPEWHFQSIMGNEHLFTLVYCNPNRDELKETPPEAELLNPIQSITHPSHFPGNQWELRVEPLTELIKGTNKYPSKLYGSYNQIGARKTQDKVVMADYAHWTERTHFYQAGIFLIQGSLMPLKERIGRVEEEKKVLMDQYKAKLEDFDQKIKRLNALATSFPRPFVLPS